MEYPPAHGKLDYDYILDLLLSGRMADQLRGQFVSFLLNVIFILYHIPLAVTILQVLLLGYMNGFDFLNQYRRWLLG